LKTNRLHVNLLNDETASGCQLDSAFLDAVKGHLWMLFRQLPFDIVGGRDPVLFFPKSNERMWKPTSRLATIEGGVHYLLMLPALETSSIPMKGYGQLIELLEWTTDPGLTLSQWAFLI